MPISINDRFHLTLVILFTLNYNPTDKNLCYTHESEISPSFLWSIQNCTKNWGRCFSPGFTPPPSSLIHPTFHVSQLKAAIGSATASELPPQLTAELELCVEPADLLGYTTSPLDDSSEVLVLWQG